MGVSQSMSIGYGFRVELRDEDIDLEDGFMDDGGWSLVGGTPFTLSRASSSWSGKSEGLFLMLVNEIEEDLYPREMDTQSMAFRLDRTLDEAETKALEELREHFTFLHEDLRVCFTFSSH